MSSPAPLVYLDTSVPNAYFDHRWRDRMHVTREWWRRVRPLYRVVISDVMLDEVARAPVRRRDQILRLLRGQDVVAVSDDARELARGYLEAAVLPRRSEADALHIAVATTAGAEYLLTWNIRHMSAAPRRARIRRYNEHRGYQSPEIVTPEELLGPESS